MIEVHEFPGFVIFKSKVLNHSDIKTDLLSAIQSMGGFKLETVNQSLLDTDWYMPREMPRPYFDIIGPILENYNRNLFQKLNIQDQQNLHLTQIWFQRYAKGDYHGLHTHGNCTFSNVYFIDLPKGTPITSFSFLNKEYEISIDEGDIITFPGHIHHQSKPNNQDEIKTSIAFNTTLG